MVKQPEFRLEKDGAVQVVTSPAEKVRLQWEGWRLAPAEPPAPATPPKPKS